MTTVFSAFERTARAHGARPFLQVLPDKGRVVVEGVGMVKRHTRPNPQKNIKGGILEKEAAIHVSNVLLVDGDSNLPGRVGVRVEADGTKVRVRRKRQG